MIHAINNCSKTYPACLPKRNQPNFGSNWEVTKNVLGPKYYATYNATCFFRHDLNWQAFCKFILKQFKKVSKVNLVCVPCSDGSEPTSLLLKLMQFKQYRDDSKKFGKINAYDIDRIQLNIAKSYKMPFLKGFHRILDMLTVFINVGKDFGKNYSFQKGHLVLAPKLREKIKYERKDIVDVVENLPKDESVVLMIRNIFPYLNDTKVKQVLKGISDLKKGSLVVIGDYDRDEISTIEKMINEQGYRNTHIENCYVKK